MRSCQFAKGLSRAHSVASNIPSATGRSSWEGRGGAADAFARRKGSEALRSRGTTSAGPSSCGRRFGKNERSNGIVRAQMDSWLGDVVRATTVPDAGATGEVNALACRGFFGPFGGSSLGLGWLLPGGRLLGRRLGGCLGGVFLHGSDGAARHFARPGGMAPKSGTGRNGCFNPPTRTNPSPIGSVALAGSPTQGLRRPAGTLRFPHRAVPDRENA